MEAADSILFVVVAFMDGRVLRFLLVKVGGNIAFLKTCNDVTVSFAYLGGIGYAAEKTLIQKFVVPFLRRLQRGSV